MTKISEEVGLSYDDVLLVPKYGILEKREQADISSSVVPRIRLEVPIVSAPMSSVTEEAMAKAMGECGGLGIIHRFLSIEEQVARFKSANGYPGATIVACAIGIHDGHERAERLYDAGCRLFCLDVAHAHHRSIERFMLALNAGVAEASWIVGNVATAEGARFLADLGADCVKVGIGPGAACITREVTGFGFPQLSAIMDVAEELDGESVTVMADGGIKNSGDIAKAIAAGANTVMLGRLLAGANEAPHPGEYFGMASKKVNGHNAPEGEEGMIESTGPVADTIKKLAWGLRSAVSYAGATDLAGLYENAKFVRVSPYASIESGVRI